MNQNSNMKQNILSVANKLIVEKGVKNTSLADIAKNANISKGTLYYHYATKDDIIFDIADSHLNSITNAVLKCVQNLDKENSKAEIVNSIMDRIATIGTHGRLHNYLIGEAITNNEALRERTKSRYIQWRITLKSQIIDCINDDEEYAEGLSFILIALVDGLVVQGLLKSEPIPFEIITKFLINHLY